MPFEPTPPKGLVRVPIKTSTTPMTDEERRSNEEVAKNGSHTLAELIAKKKLEADDVAKTTRQ